MSARESWADERRSAWLYRAMAQHETDPVKRRLFASLAEAADEQAVLWEAELRAQGGAVPTFTPGARARLVRRLVALVGPRRLLPILAAMKVRGLSVYGAARLPASHPMPESVSDFGQRHRAATRGGTLRAAVFGVNDGLVSNASLILGVAGAAQEPGLVLLSGAAGLLAGAFSMAAGEWVSVRSQRELYEHQIALERDELALYPEEETEEMALIYEARGVPLPQAREMARALMRSPEQALDTLSREELGLNPADLGSPWGAAVSSFLAFAAGAAVPLLPFVLAGGRAALPLSIVLSGASLFGVGAAISLFTGRPAARSGLRMLLIGAAAGATTYALGLALGVTLG